MSAFPGETENAEKWDGLRLGSFWKGVQLLGAMSGKKVRLPDNLGEWPGEQTEDNWGLTFGVQKSEPMRELFERVCMSLDVVWHYDARADVIELRPKWERADPRSGQALVGVLLGKKPKRWTDLSWGAKNGVGGTDHELDDWRVAFDALLSRPENFSSAGILRVYFDAHGHTGNLSTGLVTNLFVEKLRDDAGHAVILVLNRQESMSNKEDPGDVSYYLFDEAGKFLRGGVYTLDAGWVGAITSAKAEDGHGVGVEVGQGSFAMNDLTTFHFEVAKGDLILKGSTDTNGKTVNADEARARLPGRKLERVQLKFCVPAGEKP